MEPLNRYLLLQRLKQKKLRTLTGTALKQVTDEGVLVSNSKGTRKLAADSIVLALGAVPDTKVGDELKGRVDRLFFAGDCVKPRRSLEAIHEGSWIARQV